MRGAHYFLCSRQPKSRKKRRTAGGGALLLKRKKKDTGHARKGKPVLSFFSDPGGEGEDKKDGTRGEQ